MNQLQMLMHYELDTLAVAHAELMNNENPDFENEDDQANTWSMLEAKQHLVNLLKTDPKRLDSLLPRLIAYVDGFASHTQQSPTVH